MATNVIGTAITTQTLKKMEEYKDRPSLSFYDLATVAFESKNSDGKDVKAREYVESYRTKYAFDCILCMIYNATGDTMVLDTYCDTDAYIAPSPYPMIIGVGQWGVFLKRGGGAVVYKTRNANGREYQVVLMYYWVEPGRCYTEIREANYYKAKDPWATYQTPLNANASYVYQAHEHGLSSFASIGGTTKSPVFEGIVTLKGAWSRYRPVEPRSQSTHDSGVAAEDDTHDDDNNDAPVTLLM